MKIMNWNIEWMNRWFVGNANPSWKASGPGFNDVHEVAGRAANVIRAVDPDLLLLQEGPSAMQEMELFLADHLSENGAALYEPMIGIDGGAQKLYALRKKGGLVESMEFATDEPTQRLRDVWDADVDGDMLLQAYDFTRQPLVIDVDPIGAEPVRIVVLHTKSKYVDRGESRYKNPSTRQGFIVDALKNRRRISAEGFRLRGYLDELIMDDPERRIIVTGDFNDGPGRDLFERSYLTHSVTDIVLGSTFYPSLIFTHPLIERVSTAMLFTARFDDYVDDVKDRPLLLDHILVSPSLRAYVEDAAIAHAEFDAETEGDGGSRQKRPSDHRPVWVKVSASPAIS